MNRAASNLADRKLPQGHVQNERFIGKMEQEQGSYIGQKAGWLWQGHFSLGDDVVYQAGSLMLIRRFLIEWFKSPFLREPKL